MPNPNVTCARARARKWSKQSEETFDGLGSAAQRRASLAAEFPDSFVTLRMYRLGRNKIIRYVVRRYVRA